jgi:ArsR family transcriptional regulator
MRQDTLEPDRRVYEIHAEVCKVLAHPVRLQVLDILRGGPQSPSELADRLGLSRASLSQHLGVLRDRGLLRRARLGRRVVYAVTDARLFDACSTLRSLIREQLRQGAALAERGFSSPHTPSAVAAKAAQGDAHT